MADFEKELTQSFRVLKVGEVVEGMIVDINDEEVTLDLNYFVPGVIPLTELSDDPDFSAMRDLKIGDSIQAMIVDTDDGRGNVALSVKNATRSLAWETCKTYLEEGTIVNVKIAEIVNKGVITYVDGQNTKR